MKSATSVAGSLLFLLGVTMPLDAENPATQSRKEESRPIKSTAAVDAITGHHSEADPAAMRPTFDPARLVSADDVVYQQPPREPWEAMPVGGGDLSAMVRCMDGSLILHLTKSDAWGFQQPPDAPLGRRFFNNVSPGTVTLTLGQRAAALTAKRFRQRLDLYRGRIVVELGEGTETITLSIWGDPQRTVLLIAMNDPQHLVPQVTVELAEWRDSMKLWAKDKHIGAIEIHTRPARPHLANTGMQGYFPTDQDPLQGRGTAVVVGAAEATASDWSASEKAASTRLAFQDSQTRLVRSVDQRADHEGAMGHQDLGATRAGKAAASAGCRVLLDGVSA